MVDKPHAGEGRSELDRTNVVRCCSDLRCRSALSGSAYRVQTIARSLGESWSLRGPLAAVANLLEQINWAIHTRPQGLTSRNPWIRQSISASSKGMLSTIWRCTLSWIVALRAMGSVAACDGPPSLHDFWPHQLGHYRRAILLVIRFRLEVGCLGIERHERRLPGAITTLSGSARAWRRAARFGVSPRAAIASSSLRRCPTVVTPISLRSSAVSLGPLALAQEHWPASAEPD
jgi:hypothetical protein